MPCCDTGRNIQKYKGAAASTLQDALENGNTASLNINLSSPAVFIGDGGGLSNISASAVAGNLQAVTDNGAATTNKITLTNGLTSLVTSGNVLVTGNVTASFFRGDGGTLSNIAANKNFQEVTDLGATSSNKITLTNSATSLQTSGNVVVTGNVTASKFYGDGTTLTGVALSTDLVSNSTRIGTVSTDLASNSTRIGTVSTDLASNSTRIGTVSTDLASNSTRIGTVSTDLADNSTRISTVSTDLASNSTRIGTVSTDLADNSTRISTVSTDLASNSTRIGTVSTDLASNSTRIGTVSTDLASNSTRIGTVSTDLVSNSTRIGTVSTDLADNSTRISTVSIDLASNSTRIGTVSTDLASNVLRIGTLESEVQPVNRGGTNITSYGIGDMLYASASSTLSKLTPSTAGYFLQTNGTGNAPTWENVADIGSSTPANLYTDDYITGGPWSGLTDANIRVLGNVSNLSNQLVARDDKGDIFVSNVNAIKIYGDGTSLTGVALGTDLADNSTRISTVSTDLVSNSTRIGNVSTDLASNVLRIGTLESEVQPLDRGGTGQISYSTGDILYGASSGTTLNKLSPAGSNADVGKFLKLGNSDVPEWATVSVSSTTISTTDVTIEDIDIDHGLIFVSDSGTGAQALKKEYGTLKYKPSTGTLSTSNVITSDTSIHARNGIANTTPTHTLSVGTVVSIQETASGDVFIVRKGDGYFSGNVYIAKKLTVPVGGEILADKITVRSLETKGSIVFANRPPTSGIVLG